MNTTVLTSSAAVSDRIAGFDLLRGLCAMSVAAYHSLFWSGWGTLPHNMGTYAVYIFFALSGASMYVAYARRFERGYSIGRFLALRFIRLAPLYIFGLVLAGFYAVYKGQYDWKAVIESVLNITFVFGLGNPGVTSHVTGGWSIGIEFVFYLLFPVMLALTANRHWMWFVAGSLLVQHVFINTVVHGRSINEAWPSYTQFLAFTFYFVAGCAIGRSLREQRPLLGRMASPAFALCLAALVSTSRSTSEQSLTGAMGVLLSLVAATTVAASATLQFGNLGHRITDLLGRASYGVYILHPWVWALVALVNRKIGGGPLLVAMSTVAASIGSALVIEHWMEKPIRRRLQLMVR